jgi:hypothetical protein
MDGEMNWGYVAAYLDGEGHVGLHPNGNRPKSKIAMLAWYNSHHESLHDMQVFMGVGRVVSATTSELGTKPMYRLEITSKVHMVYAIDNMLPYLRIKRTAAIALRQHLLDYVDETRAKNHGRLLAVPVEDYRRWYCEEEKSLAEIAAILEATPSGILRVLRVHGFTMRGNAGSRAGKLKSEATRARMKASRAKLWEDPAFREQQLANLAKGPRGRRPKGYIKPAIQGEKHPRSKLSDADTAAIRTRYAAGGISLQALADEKHVSKKTILNIVQEKIRTHLLRAQD